MPPAFDQPTFDALSQATDAAAAGPAKAAADKLASDTALAAAGDALTKAQADNAAKTQAVADAQAGLLAAISAERYYLTSIILAAATPAPVVTTDPAAPAVQ